MSGNAAVPSVAQAAREAGSARRTLLLACLAHALHDGYTDTIYVLLPVWRAEFGLDFAALALMRGIYSGAMAALQIPASRLAERLGGRLVLVLGTALAAIGYGLAGLSGGVLGLYAALAVSGVGSGTQHPIASSAVSRAFGARARGPLGTYNFAGDIGKALFPAATSLLLTMLPWRGSLGILGFAGLLVAALLALLMTRDAPVRPPAPQAGRRRAQAGPRLPAQTGFWLLLSVGILDTGVRMGLLTFLPFILGGKGATQPMIGLALALVFIGGAAGKFTCGWLGERLGVLATTLLTEGATAACIVAVVFLPLWPAMILLPLLGVMLNGTSSVLYGTVPELARGGQTERAFAVFYTGVIGSGAVSPVLFGFLGDASGAVVATLATAATALAIFPLAIALARYLPTQGGVAGEV
jgi:MFS transporter, FSR family, fosmidomycin resistance protein